MLHSWRYYQAVRANACRLPQACRQRLYKQDCPLPSLTCRLSSRCREKTRFFAPPTPKLPKYFVPKIFPETPCSYSGNLKAIAAPVLQLKADRQADRQTNKRTKKFIDIDELIESTRW